MKCKGSLTCSISHCNSSILKMCWLNCCCRAYTHTYIHFVIFYYSSLSYIHTYIHTYTKVLLPYIHTHIHACVLVYIHTYTKVLLPYIHTYIIQCTYIHTCLCTYIHKFSVHTYMLAYIQLSYIHTVCTYIHIHTYSTSLAKLMQSCSKEFFSKPSNPNMSRMEMLFTRVPTGGSMRRLMSFTIQLNNLCTHTYIHT